MSWYHLKKANSILLRSLMSLYMYLSFLRLFEAHANLRVSHKHYSIPKLRENIQIFEKKKSENFHEKILERQCYQIGLVKSVLVPIQCYLFLLYCNR